MSLFALRKFATGLSDALPVQETNQLLEGMSSSMGFIEGLSNHLYGHAWAYPDDPMPPSIQPAAAETLYDVAAELRGPWQAEGGFADGALPAPFRCLLSMLASGNDWAMGMCQSWLLQLLLIHAEVAIAGQLKLSLFPALLRNCTLRGPYSMFSMFWMAHHASLSNAEVLGTYVSGPN